MNKTPEEMAEEFAKLMSGYKAAIDLIHSRTTKEMSNLANAFAANYFGKEYAVSFDSFLAGYQAAKELYAVKLKEANDTVAGMVDECEGLKTIIYDHDETNLPTSAQWISVKDRLPPDGAKVLLIVFGDIHYGWIDQSPSDPTEYCLYFSNTYIDKGHHALTHWMPIPSKPKYMSDYVEYEPPKELP